MIPDDIADFLRLSVRSVWTLDLLLLLRRQPERSWDAAALVRELRASQTIVVDSLARLVAIGLAAESADATVSYRATSPLEPLVAQLQSLYRERPVAVTQAVHAGATAKIQTFADSFKLRKD